ncbi:hypothetical protein BX600DRAFT_502080 [Xylariales sp. PMI_506]|nr:hypothetical protein BX600DRAFT_502080 [Xylariales sp. PMI_506]
MSSLLDEIALKILSLGIRFFQLTFSLVSLGCTAQAISNISSNGSNTPEPYVATVAICGIIAIWAAIALMLTCCAGTILLEIKTLLDLIATALSIVIYLHDQSSINGNDNISGGEFPLELTEPHPNLVYFRHCPDTVVREHFHHFLVYVCDKEKGQPQTPSTFIHIQKKR